MFDTFKKWLKKAAITGLTASLITTGTAQAFTLTSQPAVSIISAEVAPSTIDATKDEKTTISYCTGAESKVTLGIYQAENQALSKKVSMLTVSENKKGGCYQPAWDGKYGLENEIGVKGEKVKDGEYFYYLKSEGVLNVSTGSATKSGWITVKTQANQLKITDVEVDNGTFDPYDNQEAEITFSISQDATVVIEILDEDGDKVVTLVSKKPYTKGEHTVEWNGENDEGDKVENGEYTYKIKAETSSEKDTETGTVKVKKGFEDDEDTDEARIKNVFTSKENFDPGRNEKEFIVFTLMAEGDFKVVIFKDGKKIETLADEEDAAAGSYEIQWEGDEVINKEGKYTYKVITQNSNGEDMEEGTIEVEEDEKENKKPNVYKDTTAPLVFSPKNSELEISFKMEREADVTIEIRDNSDVVATVVENENFGEGSHSVYWNGKDKYGDYADDGIYEYKIVASNNKGKDTEKGKFEVKDSSVAKNGGQVSCAGFSDVNENSPDCEAIEWAVSEDIFKGYNDGTFKPDKAIERAEALKVILEALNVKMLDNNGQKLGFTDTDKNAWYASYIKTGLSLGVINGYNDGTFKPGKAVNRAEALVMMINTAKVKDNIVVPTSNYGQPYFDTPNNEDTKWYISYAWFAKTNLLTDNEFYFYPADPMTRGEMADMLFRYKNS
ncbi:MAG: S-layer homology domain-containing protein [Patescibacteria group bacterium]